MGTTHLFGYQQYAPLLQRDKELSSGSDGGGDSITFEIDSHITEKDTVKLDASRTFRDYLTDYQVRAKNREIDELVSVLALDKAKLSAPMNTSVTEANINDYGRLDDVKAIVKKQKAKSYFESLEGGELSPFQVNIKLDRLLRDFILQGGFELNKSD